MKLWLFLYNTQKQERVNSHLRKGTLSAYTECYMKVAQGKHKALAPSDRIFMTTFLKLLKLLFKYGKQRQSK